MALTTFNFSSIHQSSWRSLRAYCDIISPEQLRLADSLQYLVSTVPAPSRATRNLNFGATDQRMAPGSYFNRWWCHDSAIPKGALPAHVGQPITHAAGSRIMQQSQRSKGPHDTSAPALERHAVFTERRWAMCLQRLWLVPDLFLNSPGLDSCSCF